VQDTPITFIANAKTANAKIAVAMEADAIPRLARAAINRYRDIIKRFDIY